MASKKRCTRRDFLRVGVAGALASAAGGLRATSSSGLSAVPRVNGAVNVAPLRRFERDAGLSLPLIDPALVDLQLREVYELGFERIRIAISFNRFGADFFAAIPYVRAARALGIHVLGIIDQFSGFDLVNALSRESTREEVLEVYLALFDDVVAPATSAIPAVGAFSVQVLNEPTHFLGIHPSDYVREFLAPAYLHLKEDDPNVIVVSAAEVGGADGVLRMRAMFEAGLEEHCDRVAFHVYDERIIPRLSGMARKPVWITESGAVGLDRHFDWATRVFDSIRAGIPRVEQVFYFDLFDFDPNRFRLLDIVRDPDGGFTPVVESKRLYDYLIARVDDARDGAAHASYRELIPDVTDYFPTEADFRRVQSTSYGRRF